MTSDALFWMGLASLGITSMAAIGARSAREFSRRELEELCRRRNSRLRFSEILRHYDEVALAIESLHVLTTALFVAAAAFWIFARIDGRGPTSWGSLATSAAVAGGLLVMCKIWIPWAVARLWAAPFLFHSWRMWRLASRLLAPLTFAARFVDTVMHRLAGRSPQLPSEELFEDEIRSIVSEGHREGLFEEDAREMIEGVMELDDADVAKIMTPRTDVIMMPLSLSWPEVVDFVIDVGHTRIPVYNKNRDDVEGILYGKDLLPIISKGVGDAAPPLAEVLRKPYFVPETKRLDDLLAEFQQTHNHMALVLDEYGGVSGIVTIEDVLEEIVGEIVDEYDEDLVEEIKYIDDRTIETLARVHVDEINEELGLSIPEDGDFDTIGGFMFSELGHIPIANEELVWKGVRIQVLEASRRRIERLRIILPEPKRETA